MTQDSPHTNSPGLIVLFGSGEMSPTGRKIHEAVIKKAGLSPPVRIGILETPTGFEVNALHGWPERMQQFFEKGLRNYKPLIRRIHALRRDGEYSTDNSTVVEPILETDYLYCGAGSPGYAIHHLKDTLAYQNMVIAQKRGTVLCFGSATAVAMSTRAIPVYEIFKAGADLHWISGLDFFKPYGVNVAIVPHWNNAEGEDFDTTRCYLGINRFTKMQALLPKNVVVLGIDEQTACVFDMVKEHIEVIGNGAVHIVKNGVGKDFPTGKTCTLDGLRSS